MFSHTHTQKDPNTNDYKCTKILCQFLSLLSIYNFTFIEQLINFCSPLNENWNLIINNVETQLLGFMKGFYNKKL